MVSATTAPRARERAERTPPGRSGGPSSIASTSVHVGPSVCPTLHRRTFVSQGPWSGGSPGPDRRPRCRTPGYASTGSYPATNIPSADRPAEEDPRGRGVG